MIEMFELGRLGRCTVTRFEGIITARTDWLNGCVRYAIQPAVDKDNKVPDAYWVDEDQLEYVGENSETVAPGKPSGGPTPVPGQVADPQR